MADKIHTRLAVCDENISRLSSQYDVLSECKAKQQQWYGTTKAASELLQTLHNNLQQQTKQSVVSLVSYCLHYVFGKDAYLFDIKLEQKYNQAAATPVFIRGGIEYPYTAVGGGVLDVAAFALRLSIVLLQGYKTLLLDEPFRFVSVDYRQRVCTLLAALSEQKGVQLIMVTHIKEFIEMAGDSVRIVKL